MPWVVSERRRGILSLIFFIKGVVSHFGHDIRDVRVGIFGSDCLMFVDHRGLVQIFISQTRHRERESSVVEFQSQQTQ